MCQNTNCAQDYSLQTANTGLVVVNTANPNLDGTGSFATAITAASNGTMIRSVTIKAAAPTTAGMVRFFIQKNNKNVLYKEIPIPVTPYLTSTPTPAPVMQMFEANLLGDLTLEAGSSLVVTSQFAQKFNIITEGIDWDYPSPLPTDCCNFRQSTASTGLNIVSTANDKTDGTGTIETIYTAPSSNGALLKSISIKALQSTSINGMIRLFISADGGNTFLLWREIPVPQTTQSAFTPSYKEVMDLDFYLAPDYIIGASTQNGEMFGITIEADSWTYPI